MIKHRRTKYALFYRQPTIMDWLNVLINRHVKGYGCEPRRIYIPAAKLRDYLNSLPPFTQILYKGKDAFTGRNPTFRGVELIRYEIPA